MRTKQQYMEGLGKMKRNLYYNGEKIDRLDEHQMPCINTIGTTYDEAEKPENATIVSELSQKLAQLRQQPW